MPQNSEHNQVIEVFADAVAMSADLQGPFLDRTCGNDHRLRAEVEALLAAHARSGDFLKNSPLPSNPVSDSFIGSEIGRYKLIEMIGEGGFGSVYLAEQSQPIRRFVALKLIKLGMDTKQVIARFEAERQALALMDHPNIARVFDAGATDSGRPYFVMELARGVPITRFCADHQLNTRARLELFINVCDAIQHAHQKGVIHRDIKPGNILVTDRDASAVAKVIDFGVAKATQVRLSSYTLTSDTHALVGTPAYMSPEQARSDGGDIDTRSDIYSLGATLYELLTGVTPIQTSTLRTGSLTEITRAIETIVPAAPSRRVLAEQNDAAARARGRELRGELDWMILKCLEKERSRRYESAGALGDDIRRYLAGDAVSAAPPSRIYRLRKFVARQKLLLVTTALVVASLIAGVVISLIGIYRARVANEASAEVNRFLTDMLASADPDVFAAREQVTVKQVLDRAALRVGDSFAARPDLEAAIRSTIGASYLGLGQSADAVVHLRRAHELYTALSGPADAKTIEVACRLCNALLMSDSPAAEQFIRPILQVCGKRHGQTNPLTLQCMNSLAMALIEERQYQEAERLLREAVDQLDRANIREDDLYCNLRINLGIAIDRHKRGDASAVPFAQQALERARQAYSEDDTHVAKAVLVLASNHMAGGRIDEAIELFRSSVANLRERLGPEHPSTINAQFSLGYTLFRAGRDIEAAPLIEMCVAFSTRTAGPNDPQTLQWTSIYALTIQALPGRQEEALQLHRRVFEARRAHLGDRHAETIRSAFNVTLQLEKAGRFADALEPAALAYAALDVKDLEPDMPAKIVTEYGLVLAGLKRSDEAEPVLLRAVQMRTSAGQNSGKAYQRLLAALVETLRANGRNEDAERWRAAMATTNATSTTRPTTGGVP